MPSDWKQVASSDDYQTGAASNAVGAVERIDDFRWHLIPRGAPAGNLIEIVELLPDTQPPSTPAQ